MIIKTAVKKNRIRAGNAAQLAECFLSSMKPWLQSQTPHHMGLVAHTCKPCTGEVRADDLEFKFILGYIESRASLGYKRLSQDKETSKQTTGAFEMAQL